MAKEKKNKTAGSGFFGTLARWGKRMFFGASKELSEDEKFYVEKIESPSVMAVKSFFRRPLAVIALIVLISMFLFVFIGPILMPMDLTFQDTQQANQPPCFSMLSVPSALENNIRVISGRSGFTVGVSNDNNLYIWGSTKDVLAKIDFTKLPDAIKDGNVYTASAGTDHIIAITTDGKVVGWGNNKLGQFGKVSEEDKDRYVQMPEEFMENGVDVSKVQQLLSGAQATAMIVDGTLYVWGNPNNLQNLKDISSKGGTVEGIEKVAMTNYYILGVTDKGKITSFGNTLPLNFESAVSSYGKTYRNSMMRYLSKKTVVDIVAGKNCFAMLTDEGEVLVYGPAEKGEDKIPTIPADEKVVKIAAGGFHFVAITDKGNIYSWGYNDAGQCDVAGQTAANVYAGAKQTYLVNENNELTYKVGFKGNLMGTDGQGRDIFTRIIHGGKMTMTIGAVAVIVSTVIAIIIGCLSGYFGGWVDMLLMRITEIFSAIPFLPFAMMLSYVFQKTPVDEATRIFIIMVILGLLSWTGLARMIRAQVLAEREKEFVIAAQSMGVKESRIAFKHILPNVISVILVSVTLDFAGCMLTESSLSYLGFGVQQPQPTWGNMLDGANNSIVIQNYWWQWAFPALFLAIATISINIIGDTLRDVLDPKSSQEK